MKIPKEIIATIKRIENVGIELEMLEKSLYTWLTDNGIDPDFYDCDADLDIDLNILFSNHNGDNLIEFLKKI